LLAIQAIGMGRQKRKVRQKRIRNTVKNRCGLHLAHLPLPFGTRIDMNTFTRILLCFNDQYLDDEWHQTCQRLTQLDSDMHIFDNLKKCIEYIQQEYIEKLYVLVLKSNKLRIKNIRQNIIDACPPGQLTHFYILNGQQARVKDEEIIIDGTCGDNANDDDEDNPQMPNDKNETLVPMAIYGLTHGHEISIKDLTNDQVRFIWFQLLLDVLLKLPRNQANMNDMLEVARAHYGSDLIELTKIDEFARDYRSTKAIWWYTNDSFAYRLLNRAFRTQDIRIIFTFRFFILDLYKQLAEAARRAMPSLPKKLFRGQFVGIDELETIKSNIDGLISTNTFLSTTIDSNVAFIFAGNGSRLPSYASIVFEIDLKSDDKNPSFERPFAPIDQYSSKHDEKEILFSMGTIFRVISVEEYDSTWFICLKIKSQIKECLSTLTAHLRTENMHSIASELTLGDFLLNMGELHQAEQFYALMLRQQLPDDQNDSDKALLYNSIGLLHIDRGDYRAARILFDQAYSIAKNDRSLLSSTLNNLGLAELNQGRYNQASKYFQRAKKNNKSTKRLAGIFSNIASTFVAKGQFKKAKSYLQRALILEEKHLPPLHFDFANTYDNLAVVEMNMGNYKESLNLFEKCLNIYRQSLPSDHHLLAHALNNLGIVHSHLGEFDRAREYCEQALKIQQSSFQRTKDQHLLIAMSLNNLATLQFEQEDFSAAEGSFQRALDLKLAIEGLDSKSHPSFANAYNNLAMVQLKQGRFEEALVNFERTLNIELPIGNAAEIATTYNNIAGVHHEQNDFIKAIDFYEKALSNALIVLPKNHPIVELYENNLEKATKMIKNDELKNAMGDTDK
jgi:tetratricopeptide (TPR) repeat protein